MMKSMVATGPIGVFFGDLNQEVRAASRLETASKLPSHKTGKMVRGALLAAVLCVPLTGLPAQGVDSSSVDRTFSQSQKDEGCHVPVLLFSLWWHYKLLCEVKHHSVLSSIVQH